MSDSDELKHELSVLRAIVGVDKVGAYPAGRWDASKLNNNKVICRVKKDGVDDFIKIQVHCSAELPNKVLAAQEAKRQVTELVGLTAVQAAEEQVQRELSGSAAAAASWRSLGRRRPSCSGATRFSMS